ncbi:lipopolysaccharide biosynthesis protein, partial [Streptomyces sp. ZEA17I]
PPPSDLLRPVRRPASARRRTGDGGPGSTGGPAGPEITGDPTETLGLRSLTLPAVRR